MSNNNWIIPTNQYLQSVEQGERISGGALVEFALISLIPACKSQSVLYYRLLKITAEHTFLYPNMYLRDKV